MDKIINKTLPIAQSLYPGYKLLFMFDNATSHSIYAKDALQVAHMNKGPGGQQPFLRPGWYTNPNGKLITQEMSTTSINPVTGNSTTVQKRIQAILMERGLWPPGGVRLVCEILKCTTCQTLSKCGGCIRGQKYNSCKEAKICSRKCTKQRICDAYVLRKERCECVLKQYCVQCKEISIQKSYSECEKMPPKCTSESRFFTYEYLY